MLARLAIHQLQGRGHAGIRQDIQKRRLLQLNGERLFQGSVKHAFACSVGEIGENDGVLVSQGSCLMRTIVKPRRCKRHDQQDSRWHNKLPEIPLRSGRCFLHDHYLARTCCETTADFCVAFQPLQVGANVCGMLVAQVAVFLQRLVNQRFDFPRNLGIELRCRCRVLVQDRTADLPGT